MFREPPRSRWTEGDADPASPARMTRPRLTRGPQSIGELLNILLAPLEEGAQPKNRKVGTRNVRGRQLELFEARSLMQTRHRETGSKVSSFIKATGLIALGLAVALLIGCAQLRDLSDRIGECLKHAICRPEPDDPTVPVENPTPDQPAPSEKLIDDPAWQSRQD